MKNACTMKKTILLLLLLAPLCLPAQNPTDTIHGQAADLHYSDWYQRCYNFLYCPQWDHPYRNFFGWRLIIGVGDSNGIVANEEYTSRRLPIRGIAAMVARRPEDVDPRGTMLSTSLSRVTEELSIYQGDSRAPHQMTLLASAKMPEDASRLMILPQCAQTMHNGDSTKFLYCHTHEAIFDRPVVVDSSFYVGGTCRNNGKDSNNHYHHRVTLYVCLIEAVTDQCDSCHTAFLHYYNTAPDSLDWVSYYSRYHDMYYNRMHIGPFLAIVDTGDYTLTGMSDNEALGSVTGGGTYRTMTQAAVEAVPVAGARFSHWTDLSDPSLARQNPRIVELYYDSTVTAHFTTDEYRYVNLCVNNAAWGSATGGGEYLLGDTALLTATAEADCRFLAWSDGVSDNPRRLPVDDDTTLTAVFAPVEPEPHENIYPSGPASVIGLTVAPNPTHDRLSVSVADEGDYRVAVFTMSGHEVLRTAFAGSTLLLDTRSLAQGAYILVVSSSHGQGTARFIKQ